MAQVAFQTLSTGKGMAEKLRNPPNRRAFPRYAAERHFKLSFTAGDKSYDCQILDVSLSGALLLCSEFTNGGHEIRFEDEESGESFLAKICWQQGDRIGVEFDFSLQALDFVSRCLRETLNRLSPAKGL